MLSLDKKKLLQLVISQLEDNLKTAIDSAYEAKEASTNEEAKAENKYDTRGLEASYLASGQAARAQKIQEQVYNLNNLKAEALEKSERISVGSLVTLQSSRGLQKIFFVLPVGGIDLEWEGMKLQTLTLESPLGENLYQCQVDDEVELNNQVFTVLEVG